MTDVGPPLALCLVWCTWQAPAAWSHRPAHGRAQEASAEASMVLAQPQLSDDVRDQAIIAQLQALTGSSVEPVAGRLADTVLASAREYGDQVIAAARVTCAMISWDKGRIGEALELLRDTARRGGGFAADARYAQPLLALAAALVDLRRFDEAAAVIRAADHDKLQGIPSQVVPPILRARICLAKGRLADAATEGEAALAAAETLTAHGCASIAHSVLGMIALRRGAVAAAARHIASRPAPMPYSAGILCPRGDRPGRSPDHRGPQRSRRRPRPGPGYLHRSFDSPRAARRRPTHRGLADPDIARCGGHRTGGDGRPCRRRPRL